MSEPPVQRAERPGPYQTRMQRPEAPVANVPEDIQRPAQVVAERQPGAPQGVSRPSGFISRLETEGARVGGTVLGGIETGVKDIEQGIGYAGGTIANVALSTGYFKGLTGQPLKPVPLTPSLEQAAGTQGLAGAALVAPAALAPETLPVFLAGAGGGVAISEGFTKLAAGRWMSPTEIEETALVSGYGSLVGARLFGALPEAWGVLPKAGVMGAFSGGISAGFTAATGGGPKQIAESAAVGGGLGFALTGAGGYLGPKISDLFEPGGRFGDIGERFSNIRTEFVGRVTGRYPPLYSLTETGGLVQVSRAGGLVTKGAAGAAELEYYPPQEWGELLPALNRLVPVKGTPTEIIGPIETQSFGLKAEPEDLMELIPFLIRTPRAAEAPISMAIPTLARAQLPATIQKGLTSTTTDTLEAFDIPTPTMTQTLLQTPTGLGPAIPALFAIPPPSGQPDLFPTKRKYYGYGKKRNPLRIGFGMSIGPDKKAEKRYAKMFMTKYTRKRKR